ncbi:MAG: TetR/AcrR family transcriptional regulator [Oscillospiraceae bacterium]|nr:TetR/AcrR family transcriptional regulator [Oscillospiraceae bacterium]
MENQRIRLTKRMLKEALVRLLEHKSIDKITVYELCGEAEINRTTFYKYYSSPFALLEDIQEDFLHELENSLRENDRPISLLNILTYIDTHRTSCRALLRSASDTGILQKILSLSLIMQKMENQFVPRYTGFRKEYAMEFVAIGSYAIVKKWLLSEQPEPPEEITALILELIGDI